MFSDELFTDSWDSKKKKIPRKYSNANWVHIPLTVRDKYGPDAEVSEESSSSEEEDEIAQVSCSLNVH